MYLCLNIFLKCIGQGATTISGCTQSLPRHITVWFLLNIGGSASTGSSGTGCLSPAWLHPQCQLCCPKVAPGHGFPGLLQNSAVDFPYLGSKGNLTVLQGVPLPLALLPAASSPLLQLALGCHARSFLWSPRRTAEQVPFKFPSRVLLQWP